MELCSGPSVVRDGNSGARATDMTRTNVRYNFTWNCQNVFDWQYGQQCINRQPIQSPVFTTGPKTQLRWWLILYPRGLDFQSLQASLFLRCDNSTGSEVKAKFIFRLTHPSFGTVTSPEMKEYRVFKQGSTHGYKNFIGSLYNYNSAFNVYCEIELRPKDADSKNPVSTGPFKVPGGKLLNDMVSVFETEKFTDFVITTDGVDFPAHKAILAARSSVFASMFEHNLKERVENRVEIPDTTTGAIKEMLRFIYTDEVTEIEDVAEDLLALAEKYALESLDRLEAMCEEALREMINAGNAADLLILADLHRADQLKTRAIDFINCNTVGVMDTSGFKSMITSHPHLTAEILRASVTRKNRDEDF